MSCSSLIVILVGLWEGAEMCLIGGLCLLGRPTYCPFTFRFKKKLIDTQVVKVKLDKKYPGNYTHSPRTHLCKCSIYYSTPWIFLYFKQKWLRDCKWYLFTHLFDCVILHYITKQFISHYQLSSHVTSMKGHKYLVTIS